MDHLTENVKKLLLLGIGAAATTAEKSKDIIDDLVKKGEITVDQGKVLNEGLKRKASNKVSDAMLHRVENLSKAEREALKAKLAEMDSEEEEKQED